MRIVTPEEMTKRMQRIEPNVPHMLPLVSVVVASYNRPENLEKCLESVYQQVYPCWELIVSDDGSDDDGPRRIAERYDAKWVTKLHDFDSDGQPMPNIARVLNAGMALATGSIVQTLQQDHVLAPDFLLWLVRAFQPQALVWGLTDHRSRPMELEDIQSMLRTLHFPDGEIRYGNYLCSGRRLLVEMTDWRNTDGLDCAFEREGAPLFDEAPEMVGQSHVWPDWIAQNVVKRGTQMLINPMMRLWHLEHPERPDRQRWMGQIERSYGYMKRKWETDIWNSYMRGILFDARGYYHET